MRCFLVPRYPVEYKLGGASHAQPKVGKFLPRSVVQKGAQLALGVDTVVRLSLGDEHQNGSGSSGEAMLDMHTSRSGLEAREKVRELKATVEEIDSPPST